MPRARGGTPPESSPDRCDLCHVPLDGPGAAPRAGAGIGTPRVERCELKQGPFTLTLCEPCKARHSKIRHCRPGAGAWIETAARTRPG
jgi:hypothetical protein